MARAKEVPIRPVPTIAIMVKGSSKFGLAGSIRCEGPACLVVYLTPLDACQTPWNAGPRGAMALLAGGQRLLRDVGPDHLGVGLPSLGQTGGDQDILEIFELRLGQHRVGGPIVLGLQSGD